MLNDNGLWLWVLAFARTTAEWVRENARFRTAMTKQLPANTADKQKARPQGRAFVFE
jgi:hypothetical protein